MILGILLKIGGAVLKSIAQPAGDLPADAYQQPETDGDQGYWSYRGEGYYQEPEV